MTIVEQIHQEFNSAQSYLLLNKPNAAAECLHDLGFCKSKSTEDYYINNEGTRVLAEYYQRQYPNHRFITEKQVEIICHKYGLFCTPVGNYLGEVPVSKVAAMISFRVKVSDANHRIINQFGVERHNVTYGNDINGVFTKDPEALIKATDLWICAPESEIDTRGLTKTGHNISPIHVKDPVVLQPVKGGFLIVAAWGDEASDENVVNHKMN